MENNQSLSDKIILVTGGSSLIGSAIALKLSSQGAALALTYRQRNKKVESLNLTLRQAGARAEWFEADLSKASAAETLIKNVVEKFGRLDALVNNASAFPETPLASVKESEWDEIFAINCRTPFFVVQASASLLKASRGSIVNISDIYGALPILPNRIPYIASKAALNAVTKALAHALAPAVRVNAVAPGAITFPSNYTEKDKEKILHRIPLGRTGSPNDIAEAVLFLLTEGTYITGQVFAIDGGRSL